MTSTGVGAGDSRVGGGGAALEGLIDALPHGVVVADSRGRITLANRAAADLLGYTPGELCGLSVEDLVPEELREGHRRLRGAFADGSHGSIENLRPIEALARGGRRIPVLASLSRWEDGGEPRFVVSLLDDGPRHTAEVAAETRRDAAEAGEFSQAIIRDAPLGIAVFDAETARCISANRAVTTITGVSNQQLMATPFREIPVWKATGVLALAEECIATGEPASRDFEGVTSVGKTVMITIHMLVTSLRGRPHLVVMVNDQTARRNLEEQVRVAQKMEAIGQLAGGVAHDFNNLLTVIGTYSSMMMEDFAADDPRRADLEEVFSAAKRAASLTRQLLAFGRRQLLNSRLLNVNEIVSSLEKMLRRVLSAEIKLEIKLDPDLGMIFADEGQMEQAIMNLVVNARDAMPRGGRITVETMNIAVPPDPDAGSGRSGAGRRLVPREKVLIRVSDTGVGMDEATIARVFEPFFTTKAPGKGTGLGLATTYGIVKQTGGTIEVRSKPGEGTTFELRFRRMTGATGAAAPQGPGIEDASGTGNVLVVEDDDHVRRIVINTLEERGYTVTAVRNGREALDIAGKWDKAPDLVVTDIIMPELNGRELVVKLRERWPQVPVLFMTAYAVDEVTGGPASDLPGSLLRKPFIPSELGAAVRETLQSR